MLPYSKPAASWRKRASRIARYNLAVIAVGLSIVLIGVAWLYEMAGPKEFYTTAIATHS